MNFLLTLLLSSTGQDFGITGDIADCITRKDEWIELQNAIDNAEDDVLDLSAYTCIYSSRTLYVDRPGLTIKGKGQYRFSFGKISGTYIRFPKDVDGFHFGAGSVGSRLEKISLVGLRDYQGLPACTEEPSPGAKGIVMFSAIELVDSSVISFSGDGLLAQCGYQDHLGRVNNCNNARLNNFTAQENAGWGIWKSGGDANAWKVDAYSANSNRCGCLYTREFLGSDYSYVFCQEADFQTAGGIQATNPNARNVFSWVYLENPTQINLTSPSVRLGGFGAQTNGSFIEGATLKGPWAVKNAKGGITNVLFGEACGDKCALSIENEGVKSQPLKLFHDGELYWFSIGPVVKALGLGDILNPSHWGKVFFPFPISLGVPPNDRNIFWHGGKPTESCRPGDIRFNTDLGFRGDKCSFFACIDSQWTCGAKIE